MQPVSGNNAYMLFSFYPFLKADGLWHLSPEDASFLEQRRCLHVPARPILDEFIREYFLHVHPILPVLNERDFWSMYSGPDPHAPGRTRMSLFVFQAMLFISCPVSFF